MRIQFEGAAQTVTGSQTLIKHKAMAALVDCGLYQAPKPLRLLNWNKPQFFNDVQSILLTHAHIDHSGLIPRWAHWGWKGKVFCSPATADLLQIMLLDSARLQEEDARFANRTKHSHHDPALPLYTEKDALHALKYLNPIDYNIWHPLSDRASFRFLRAGHILGSAIVQVAYTDMQISKILTFSGDLGGGHSQLLKDPVSVHESDYLVLESTYGNRKIEYAGREERFAAIVNKVIARGGTLVIPAFALGRTQDLLFSLFEMQKKKMIGHVPVYLDSPMAKEVTKVYLKNRDELIFDSTSFDIEKSLSPSFFHSVESPEDSMLLCMSDEPKIVLSASGMLQGGRVLHHLKHKLPNKKNAVLFVGFQGEGTKGRLLVDGLMNIRIHHQEISVEAEVLTLEGYSAHADVDDMLSWLKKFNRPPERIFLNHGERQAQDAFAKRIREELGIPVSIPALHEEFQII